MEKEGFRLLYVDSANNCCVGLPEGVVAESDVLSCFSTWLSLGHCDLFGLVQWLALF